MIDGAKTGTLLTMQEAPHLFEVYFGEKFLFGFYYKERKTVESLVHAVNDHVGPALTEALKVAGEAAKPITMSDVRLRCGEGTLSPRDVLFAVNAILKRRGDALERIRNNQP